METQALEARMERGFEIISKDVEPKQSGNSTFQVPSQSGNGVARAAHTTRTPAATAG